MKYKLCTKLGAENKKIRKHRNLWFNYVRDPYIYSQQRKVGTSLYCDLSYKLQYF